jgi:hypothetical protein
MFWWHSHHIRRQYDHYVYVERVTDLLGRIGTGYISLFCAHRSVQVLTRSTRFAKALSTSATRAFRESQRDFASGLYLM